MCLPVSGSASGTVTSLPMRSIMVCIPSGITIVWVIRTGLLSGDASALCNSSRVLTSTRFVSIANSENSADFNSTYFEPSAPTFTLYAPIGFPSCLAIIAPVQAPGTGKRKVSALAKLETFTSVPLWFTVGDTLKVSFEAELSSSSLTSLSSTFRYGTEIMSSSVASSPATPASFKASRIEFTLSSLSRFAMSPVMLLFWAISWSRSFNADFCSSVGSLPPTVTGGDWLSPPITSCATAVKVEHEIITIMVKKNFLILIGNSYQLLIVRL